MTLPLHDPKAKIRSQAKELGFDLAGFSDVSELATWPEYRRWLDVGHEGKMSYLSRRADERKNVRSLFPEAQSVIVLGTIYHSTRLSDLPTKPMGRVASYALGYDYHDVLKSRMDALILFIQNCIDPHAKGKSYVDTAPILERDLAARAGLGWFGKNTNLINKEKGSWFLLSEILLTTPFTPDSPTTAHCGTCSRCLDECPTKAFVGPYVLDARRCISYLTIELKGPIPRDLRPLMGNHVFGCDICQDVCPWNSKAPETADKTFAPQKGIETPDLIEWMGLNDQEFRQRFRESPLSRPKRRGLLRNVAVALGNSRDRQVIPVLIEALNDHEPLIRGHVVWALSSLAGPEAMEALTKQHDIEEDSFVIEELSFALGEK